MEGSRVERAAGPAGLSNWRGDLLAGLTVAITSLPFAIACGSIAFAPLGTRYIAAGVVAGIVCTIVTSIVASLVASCPIQITGTRASLAAMAAALFSTVSNIDDPTVALALLAVAGGLGGIFQMFLGLSKVGRLIAYIPYPVIAGFMNGVAIMILISQLRPALGIPSGTAITSLHAALSLIQPVAVIVAAVTAIVTVLGPRLVKRIPAPMLGMVVGIGVFDLLQFWLVPPVVGERVGAIPVTLSIFEVASGIKTVLLAPQLMTWLLQILPIAWSLAFTGSIETLMNAASADASLGTRTNADRELFGQGIANMASAICGGLFGASTPSRTFANFHAGGRTRLSGIAHGVWLLLFFVVLQPVVAHLPISVTAGIMIAVAVTMLDRWTQSLVSVALFVRRTSWPAWANLGVVALVAIALALFGLMAAIVTGLATTSAMFLANMIRDPVQRSFRCGQVRSKKIWSGEDLDRLREAGDRVVVHCLRGEIFFGTIEPLSRALRNSLEGTDIAIVDFRRVSQLDATGVRLLQQAHGDYRKMGKHLVLSGLTEDHPVWIEFDDLSAVGAASPAIQIFGDMDSALEWAERTQLSAARNKNRDERGVEQVPYFSGLDAARLSPLLNALTRKHYPAGTTIYRDGDVATGMLFITAGSVSVLKRIADSSQVIRLAGVGQGKVIGEMAILSGERRSADVRADEDVIGYELLRADFEALSRQWPEIGLILLANIGSDLARRLATTSHELVDQNW